MGMKSVRLDEALEQEVRAAADLLGVSESQLMRDAIGARCRAVLGERLDLRLSDYVGVVSRGGGRAQATGQAFGEALRRRGTERDPL